MHGVTSQKQSSSSSKFCINPSGLFPSELIWNYGSLLTVGRTPWTVDQPVARPLPTQDNTDTE
jgi:hypothetical protein